MKASIMKTLETGNTYKMRWLMDTFVTRQQFEKDLEESLTIISYPNIRKDFYVCEHISASSEKRMVNVHVHADSKK